MAKSRHKPSRRGRQPGQRPPARPADPILAAAAVAAIEEPAPEPVVDVAPPEVADAPSLPAAPVTPRTARGMSLLALSQVLGVGRSVVEGWVQRHGCPPIRDSNGKGTGNEWSFDLAAVVAWRIEHERRTTIAEMGAEAIEPKDRLILLKIAKEANLVVPVAAVEAMYERANGKARQAIMSASTRLARSMDGFPADRVSQWALQADEILRDVLKTWQEDASSIDLTPSDHVMVLDDADPSTP